MTGMKKWLILLIIGVTVSVIYFLVITYVEYTPKWLAGEKVTVKRGNIRSPISASGRIEPAERIEIKSQASGEVTQICINEGDYVRAGEVLIVLDPNEERLATEKAEFAVSESEKQLKIATANATKAKESGVLRAEATARSTEARTRQSELQYRLLEKARRSREAATSYEVDMAKATWDEAAANHETALAGVVAAKLDSTIAAEQAESARSTLETAKRNLDDARRRLSQTTIYAPSDGMIAKIYVQIGSLVQSGTRSLTGGTPLAKLADTSRLYVIAMVDDADFGIVRKIAPPEARPQMRPGPKRERFQRSTSATTTTGAADASSPSTSAAQSMPSLPVDPTRRVKVMVDTFPDDEFWGVIERIDPEGEVHGAIVQYRVHVRLVSSNAYDMLQLGLPAQVEFTAESRDNVLCVESRCVRKQGDDYGVFVPDPKPQDKLATRFVKVRTGISDGTNTEILEGSGLKEGDEVYRVPPAAARERGKD